ncbi:MAG: restriction endonuclease subunit S [Victivallaceae bacterium]|jgi:restriction endonuclease S subunit
MESKNKMQVSANTYLKFTSLSNTIFWDFYSLSNKNSISSKYPLIKLKEVLNHRKVSITIDDAKLYKRCRVQVQAKGVILRDEVIGKEIKTKKQQLCKTDDFLVAEIDAKVGGYGIVPNDLQDAIVSGHYFLFEIDKAKLLPEFLGIVVKQNNFFKQVKSTGSTNYAAIRPSHVLEYQIPLPDIAQQEKIVNAYNQKNHHAQLLEQKVNNLNIGIGNYFLSEFGIEKNSENITSKGLKIFYFKDIDRWDVWVNKSNTSHGKYPTTTLGKIVIGKPSYGANVKGVKAKSATRYIRITDINENGTLNDEFVSPESVEEKYLLKENDFLIARSGNTVGKTFLYKEKYGCAIYAGYLVKYNIDTSKVIPEYLLEYTKSYPFKMWIDSNQRAAGQPNINGQEFLQAPLILPPLEIQKSIVSEITKQREKIIFLKNQIETMKSEAEKKFKKEIFG